MKKLLRVLGAIVLLVVLTAAFVYVWGEPISRMPGRHLHGTVVTQPVEDWSFATTPKGVLCQIEVDSDPPQAVNIACIGHQKDLYVGHMVRPHRRPSWAELLALNPTAARIRFGRNIYPVAATPVTDQAERQRIWDTGYAALHPQNVPASPPDSFLLFKLTSH
jgi:hypothetical protein